jgi:hypothetical protein
MKKTKIFLFAFLSFVLITSCDEGFEELNTDPNNPVEVPAHLLLSQTQSTHMNMMYGMGRGADMGGCWVQQWSKVQYNSEARYIPRRGTIDGMWNVMYTSIISEANAMQGLAATEGNASLEGAALVMKAIGFQTLVDLFGPVPFTEALDAANLKPAYDDEATVYAGILDMLDQAAAKFSQGGSITASSDLYYAGDVSKWKKLANTLKFRALMRISSTRSVGGELSALLGKMFTSNDDNATVKYLSAAPDANPIYETVVDGSRLEYKVNSVLVDKLKNLNDDRLAVYASPNASGDILGKPAGFGLQTTLPNEALGYTYANISGLGSFYLNAELPGVLISYSQLNFLLAEAYNEGHISGGINIALSYFREGISSSFAFNKLDATSYLAQPNLSFASQSEARTKIGLQAWIASYGQGIESWTEYRRTGLPELQAAEEGDLSSIPARWYYPTTEVSLNKANYEAASQTIGGDQLTSTLFWQ